MYFTGAALRPKGSNWGFLSLLTIKLPLAVIITPCGASLAAIVVSKSNCSLVFPAPGVNTLSTLTVLVNCSLSA